MLYSEKVMDHFQNPPNLGKMETPMGSESRQRQVRRHHEDDKSRWRTGSLPM